MSWTPPASAAKRHGEPSRRSRTGPGRSIRSCTSLGAARRRGCRVRRPRARRRLGGRLAGSTDAIRRRRRARRGPAGAPRAAWPASPARARCWAGSRRGVVRANRPIPPGCGHSRDSAERVHRPPGAAAKRSHPTRPSGLDAEEGCARWCRHRHKGPYQPDAVRAPRRPPNPSDAQDRPPTAAGGRRTAARCGSYDPSASPSAAAQRAPAAWAEVASLRAWAARREAPGDDQAARFRIARASYSALQRPPASVARASALTDLRLCPARAACSPSAEEWAAAAGLRAPAVRRDGTTPAPRVARRRAVPGLGARDDPGDPYDASRADPPAALVPGRLRPCRGPAAHPSDPLDRPAPPSGRLPSRRAPAPCAS